MTGHEPPAGRVAVRTERPGDEAGIRVVHDDAFGQPAEGRLVDELRGRMQPWLSLVAEQAGRVVGHVLFTPVTIRDGAATSIATALGPLGVQPSHQRLGVGSALTRAGLHACREHGETVIFVLGDPAYYARFGFRLAAPLGLGFTAPGCEDAFQVVELVPGALRGRGGTVEYHPAFDDV